MADYTRLTDTVNCQEGRAYMTKNGQNRKLFDLSKLTADVEIKTKTKQMLGHRVEQTKPTGMKITGSLTVYLMTSDFIDYARKYKETGVLDPITIQTVMEDPQSTVGRSEILLKDVVLSKAALVNIDDSTDDAATFDTDFTAGEFEILSRFGEPESY